MLLLSLLEATSIRSGMDGGAELYHCCCAWGTQCTLSISLFSQGSGSTATVTMTPVGVAQQYISGSSSSKATTTAVAATQARLVILEVAAAQLHGQARLCTVQGGIGALCSLLIADHHCGSAGAWVCRRHVQVTYEVHNIWMTGFFHMIFSRGLCQGRYLSMLNNRIGAIMIGRCMHAVTALVDVHLAQHAGRYQCLQSLHWMLVALSINVTYPIWLRYHPFHSHFLTDGDGGEIKHCLHAIGYLHGRCSCNRFLQSAAQQGFQSRGSPIKQRLRGVVFTVTEH